MIKEQEEQNQMNVAMLHSLKKIQRQTNSGYQTTNPEWSGSSSRRNSCKRSNSSRRVSRDRTYTPEISSSRSSDSEESTGGSSSSSHRGKRKRHYKNNSHGEFKKAKPPTFDGEVKYGQEVEAWILGMRNYFQVQEYSGNMKERVAIFKLNGRASIWWEHLRKVKKISERRIVWKQFKKYFK